MTSKKYSRGEPNQGVNFGYSSRLGYDACFIKDSISESVAPMKYRLDPNYMNNCSKCLSVFGPRPSMGGASYGVSTSVGDVQAQSQALVDIDSVLSNRNMIYSRCRDGEVNDIDVTKFPLQHARICNDFLDPIATHLTNPPQNYRGLSINRFFDLPKNPQANIFWNFAVNTQLEAKDNYRARIPRLQKFDPSLPVEVPGRAKPCYVVCPSLCNGTCN